jgi:hypothetical protein
VQMKKERFPKQRILKFMPRQDGPFSDHRDD